MKDAPKDGTEIFAACFEDTDCIVRWREDCQAWQDTYSGRFRMALAWMPKPHLSDFTRRELAAELSEED